MRVLCVPDPPFCPWPACRFHASAPSTRWWRRAGSHHTRCFGEVPRFKCSACRRTFSSQTFSTDYYAKRIFDYRRLEALLSSSMSLRSLARTFRCSCGSIQNRCDRLSRQALAAHTALRPLAARPESVCIDGFVSFDRSQYFPNNLTISIASSSRFALAVSHASLRRSGRLREDQKKKLAKLYRGLEFEPRALERSFSELLDELERDRPPRRDAPLIVVTDEKQEYARAFAAHRLFREQDQEHRVVHHRVSSRLPRTIDNPLFASNYLDRELRKDQAAHRRETTCFARSAANGMTRMACYLDWHNYEKRYEIKAPVGEKEVHAEVAGIPREAIRRERRGMFRWRTFLSRIELAPLERRIWEKAVPTPGRPCVADLPAFAFG